MSVSISPKGSLAMFGFYPGVGNREARERGHGAGIPPLTFQKGETRAEVPFHNSIICQGGLIFSKT